MAMFVYLSCDLRLIAGRRLLFVLMSRNMRPAIGRMSQVAVAYRKSQIARHVNERNLSRRSQIARHRKRTCPIYGCYNDDVQSQTTSWLLNNLNI
ncbi:unnamed protein product [Brassica oleracea var. botrytis]|uniref:(rape) hypothetical protein n=1 Tax=Brassica napus TaxID=3708 RepID=A0A816KP75_BRANA|nr:unnamed protein product [Brassica napus]